MNSSVIHVAVASDERYVPHAAVTMLSACIHAEEGQRLRFHFMSNRVSTESLDKLRHMVEAQGHTLTSYEIDDVESFAGIKLKGTIALSSYARLFLSSLLPQEVDRLIYLDSDSVVVDSLMRLWEYDLGDALLGAVMDVAQGKCNTAIGLPEHNRYINSGMLLIPLSRWREESVEDQLIDFLHRYQGEVFHHDQGVINAVLANRILILPPRYNLMTFMYEFTSREIHRVFGTENFYSDDELCEAKSHPCFIHFTESLSSRPWMKGCTHPERELYRHVQDLTPWRDCQLEVDSRSLPLKLLVVSHRLGGVLAFSVLRKFFGLIIKLIIRLNGNMSLIKSCK